MHKSINSLVSSMYDVDFRVPSLGMSGGEVICMSPKHPSCFSMLEPAWRQKTGISLDDFVVI